MLRDMGEVLNMFIAITAALSTVVPAEVVRIILAAAVGYTIANKMGGSADNNDDDDTEDDIEEEDHDDVKNNIVPSMIAFSTDYESRPALVKSSTLSSSDISAMSKDQPGKLIRQRSQLLMNEDEDEEILQTLQVLETVLNKRKQRRQSLSEEVETEVMLDKQMPKLRPRLTKSQSEYNSSVSEWKDQTRPKARPRLMKSQSEYNSSGWQDQVRDRQNKQGSKETQDDIRLSTIRNSLARMPSISFHLRRSNRRKSSEY